MVISVYVVFVQLINSLSDCLATVDGLLVKKSFA